MQVYADNAATTRMSEAAVSAMLPYLRETYGNPSSLHSAGQMAAQALVSARERIARCLGCEAKEITFTSGGSESDNQALLSAAYYGKRNGKTHIISTEIEHHAVLNTLKKLEAEGFHVTLLKVSPLGIVDPEQIRQAITDQTCLVSVMFANNEIGTVQPVNEIGKICRDQNIIFHTDAVQAAGHLKIDVRKQNIDLLSLSAHKFHGPKGIGVLYARKGIPLTSIITGGAQERGKRAGTQNIPAIMGMTAALEEAVSNLTEKSQKLLVLRDQLIDGLSQIPHAVLNGDRKNRLPGNISFCFEGITGESQLLLLDGKGICASGGSACASGSLEPSHVLQAIGRSRNLALGALRLSLSEENTEDQINYIIKSVKNAVDCLRSAQ